MSDSTGSSSSSGSVSRRQMLLGGAAGVAALGASSALGSVPVWASNPIRSRVPSAPFSLGVASGDPLPDGASFQVADTNVSPS
jgi:alkaline phosphatase D